ncbi:DNA-binding protein [Candidatus Bathyarchaeota archaeon]|nr:DNA-binding protein [Candidatus Bathyarchaeota archaeon]
MVVERVKGREPIEENITAVTLVEYPRIVYYKHFTGSVIFPIKGDYLLAHRLQLALLKMGRPQAFSDLLTAAVVVGRGEELSTYDEDFKQISEAAEKMGLIIRLHKP